MANDYVLTEIWKARPSWGALSREERQRFFDTKINGFLGSMVSEGAEIVACAVNENAGSERIEYTCMAIWKVPDAAFASRIETGAAALGFLDYFEQVNFSGSVLTPPQLNAAMIGD